MAGVFEVYVKTHFSAAHSLQDIREIALGFMVITGSLKFMLDAGNWTRSGLALISAILKRASERFCKTGPL